MTDNVLLWCVVLLLAGTTVRAQSLEPVLMHSMIAPAAGPLSESIRRAAATLARNPVGGQSVSAQPSHTSHDRCANWVMLGAGAGFAYAVIGPQGSDAAGPMLRWSMIAGGGLGALIGSRRGCH
jgi:hypothetical protein